VTSASAEEKELAGATTFESRQIFSKQMCRPPSIPAVKGEGQNLFESEALTAGWNLNDSEGADEESSVCYLSEPSQYRYLG
jgi:hypothetical protein